MDYDVKNLSVTSSEDALTGKALLMYDPTTGEPSAFDASTMFKGADKYYGVQWFTGTVTNPSFTDGQVALLRVGNSKMHQTLPVQSLMRGCLLDDDGNVVEYLSGGWEDHDLSGAKGQVMVEVPGAWWRFPDQAYSGDIRNRSALVSLDYFEGAHFIPRFYVGAYEAYRDANGKLCSIAGVKPTISTSMTAFRTAARKRNTANNKWNILPYEQYKVIFWLYMIEYANRNSQADVNTSRDANGFRQGGLGTGVTNVSNWSKYNGYYPFVITGTSNALGDDSGEVNVSASEYVNNGVTLVTSDSFVHVNRYRGIELPFGHIWKFIDGIMVYALDSATDRTVYTTDDPAKFAAGDTSISGWANIGKEAGTEGYVKKLIFGSKGEIMASEVGAGSTNYWADYHYVANIGIRAFLFGGIAHSGASAGLACSHSHYAPSDTTAFIGSRLCFIP